MTPYYEVDGITLYLGDCREITEWLAADVLVTDPPYGIGWRGRAVRGGRSGKDHPGIVNDHDVAARDTILSGWGDRPGIVFGSLYAPLPPRLRHVLVWEKPPDAGLFGSTTGYRRNVEAVYLTGAWPMTPPSRGSVLRSGARSAGNPSSPAGRTGHPHAKPVDLLAQLIDAAPPGTVADPFAGSGSTLVAARNQGRAAIGVEVEERYCEIAALRLAQGVLL